ncbi:MAG TPA: hypothetical protein VFQ61_23745 [Polyangiaceae bacterium]|nr:hypothetical protein [Polyangiaceae bacterium]
MHRCYACALPLILGLAALSCSDPVPASAAVGLTLKMQPSASCPYDSNLVDDIGQIGGDGKPQSPNSLAGTPGKRVYSGESGLDASCSITGGGPFSISGGGSMSDPRISFNIEGTMNANGQGTATMTFASNSIGEGVTSDPGACTLTAVQTSDGVQIHPGAMWAQFNCPSVKNVPTINCMAFGELILENCKK